MKNIFYKSICLSLFLLIGIASFGQNKSFSTQNFTNPFTSIKKDTGQIVIQPKTQNQLVTQKKKNFTIQKEGNYFMIQFKDESEVNGTEFFNTFSNELKSSNEDSFKLIRTENDEIGFTHFRYQQLYNGIKVMGGEYLLHEKNGKLISANGNFYSGLSIPIIPTLSKERAIENAMNFVGAEKYLWNNKDEEDFLKSEKNDTNATYSPSAELIIAPKDGVYETGNFRLCYRINIASEKPYDIVDVYVDALTGEVINKISKIAHADVTGTGSTLYSGTKSITMDSYNGSYRLRESGRPIQTFNMKNGTSYANAVDFTNSTTNWANTQSLNSFTISKVTTSWWYAVFADEYPDLYIIVKDGSNAVV